MNEKIIAEQTVKAENAQKILDSIKPEDKTPVTNPVSDIIEDLDKKVKTPQGVKTIKELYDGHLMQSDYTKKTTVLKDKEKQIEKDMEEAAEYIAATQDYFKTNPKVYDHFAKSFSNPDGSAPEVEEPTNGSKGQAAPQRSAEYDNLINVNKKAIEQLQQSQRETDVDKAIAKVQRDNKLTNEDMEMVLGLANGNYNEKKSFYENINDAFTSFKSYLTKQTKSIESKKTNEAQQKMDASFFGGSTKAPSNTVSNKEFVTKALGDLEGAAREIL